MRKGFAAFFLLLLLVTLPIVLVIDTSPAVRELSSAQLQQADRIPTLIGQLKAFTANSSRPQQITLNKAQIDSLSALIARARSGWFSSVALSPTAAELTLSLPIADSGLFFNARASVQSGNGLTLDNVKVGDLPIPASLARWLLVKIGDRVVNLDISERLLNRVEKVTTTDNAITITLSPVADLLAELKSRPTQLDEDSEQFRRLTTHYLTFLGQQPRPAPEDATLTYLRALFGHVAQQSQGEDAALHNQAATMAMAIFAGSQHFSRFIGGVEQPVLANAKSPLPLQFANRHDLFLHFIFSAAIEILSDHQVTYAIGEFKELMDRNMSGSGFSFADLAADLTGSKFARCLASPDYATELQQRLPVLFNEQALFPRIDDLPEGMHEDEFQQKIGGVDSPVYRQLTEQIQQRIDALLLFAAPASNMTPLC